MLKAVNQRPQDLRLVVIQADKLHQTPLPALKSLKQRDITLGRWRIRFCIIGESHQVQVWRDSALQFVEMLACVDVPPSQCTHHHPFDVLNSHLYQMPSYQIQVDFCTQPRPVPHCDGALRFAFPISNGVLPITEVRWWADVEHLHWWTLHTYPQRQTITYVYSQSSLTLKID